MVKEYYDAWITEIMIFMNIIDSGVLQYGNPKATLELLQYSNITVSRSVSTLNNIYEATSNDVRCTQEYSGDFTLFVRDDSNVYCTLYERSYISKQRIGLPEHEYSTVKRFGIAELDEEYHYFQGELLKYFNDYNNSRYVPRLFFFHSEDM